MKVAISFLVSMAITASADARPDDELAQQLQLKVSNAYSRCAAYYEISASVRDATNGFGTDDALVMKQESMTIAVTLASEHVGTDKAGRIADEGFAEAIYDMHNHIKSDPESFREWAEKQRQSCRMAVNDPPTFVAAFLAVESGQQRKRSFFQLPKHLTVEDILKNGKPSTGTRQVSKCEGGKEIDIPLDNVLIEGGMVCAQHQGEACQSERSWMSYSQYIQSLYPGREFGGHVFTMSVSFVKGQRQDEKTLAACLLLPATST